MILKILSFGDAFDSGYFDSVCSAVGVLPLSLQYGFPIVEKYDHSCSFILTQ